ncbi:TRAPPC13 [Bugula neritina]|uniref:TRAPPC13 n=1 Tax=Bugula neritina TaxID=10212 RepID=A0A7J7K0M7_BUGNE|nr:TRAPPC13 [Bugula neritina]
MTSAEKEHLLTLKVMRLTKPSLGRANLVYLDGRDVDGSEDPYLITNQNDANVISPTPYESNSPALLLPQSFGNIFLGETFSSYISIHNASEAVCRNVSVKIELQTNNNRHVLSTNRNTVPEVSAGQCLEEVISHEVKEMGTHIMVCTINYTAPSAPKLELRKFFKFQVLKPLELKTKFVNAETGDVYLEAQIQNITPTGIYLEKVALEPAPEFVSQDLSHTNDEDPFERYINPLDMYQFLFRVSPKLEIQNTPKLLKETTAMGKLDIHWRSNMGEKGRLQTSSLQRTIPGSGDIKLTVKSMQSTVDLEQSVDIKFQITNCSERKMDLRIELLNSKPCGILWTGISGRQLGTLEANKSIVLNYTFVPIKPGLQSVSGIRIVDVFLKKTHEYDNIAHIFVK